MRNRKSHKKWVSKQRQSVDAVCNSDAEDKPIKKEWETNPFINAMREASSPVDNTIRNNLMKDAELPLSLLSAFDKASPIMSGVINKDYMIQNKIANNILDFQNNTITHPEIIDTFINSDIFVSSPLNPIIPILPT